MNCTAIYSRNMNLLQYIARPLAQLFFPHVCRACGSDVMDNSQLLCLHCLHHLPYTHYQQHAHNPVLHLFTGRLQLLHAASILYLTKQSIPERLLYQLKYNYQREIGLYCGRLMGNAIIQSPFAQVDALMPLPLHASKERKRGYNQSTLLCEGIAAVTGKPVWTNAMERVSATETQTHRNRTERWQNMLGRFRVRNAAKLPGRHVLLVDDVVTTGATLESCGAALTAAGASVSILTLACAASGTV